MLLCGKHEGRTMEDIGLDAGSGQGTPCLVDGLQGREGPNFEGEVADLCREQHLTAANRQRLGWRNALRIDKAPVADGIKREMRHCEPDLRTLSQPGPATAPVRTEAE